MVVNGSNDNDAGQILRRLMKRPAVWGELEEHCFYLQFQGAGEKVQPTFSLRGVFLLIMHLPGTGAARFRARVAMLLVQLMAKEAPADVDACRGDMKLRGLFADIAREEVAAAAGAGAPVDDAENLQLQRRTQLRLEHADAVMKDAAALTTVTDAVRAKAAADVAAAEAVRVKAAADAEAVRAKAAADAEAVRVKAAADVDALQQVGAADSRIRKQRDEDAMEAHAKRMREADEMHHQKLQEADDLKAKALQEANEMHRQKLQEADDLKAKALQEANELNVAKARAEAIARQAAQALANDSLRATARGLLLKRAETIAEYYAVLPDTPDRQQRVDAYVALLEQQACWEAPPPQAAPPPPPPPRAQIPEGAFLVREFAKEHKLLGGLRGEPRDKVIRLAGWRLTEYCTNNAIEVFRTGGESNHYPPFMAQLAFDIITSLVREAHGQPDIGSFFTQPSQPSPPQPDDAERAPAGAGASA